MLTVQQISDLNFVQRKLKEVMVILISVKSPLEPQVDEEAISRQIQEEISRLSKINMRIDILLSTYSK